jgi:hypothetical protein
MATSTGRYTLSRPDKACADTWKFDNVSCKFVICIDRVGYSVHKSSQGSIDE